MLLVTLLENLSRHLFFYLAVFTLFMGYHARWLGYFDSIDAVYVYRSTISLAENFSLNIGKSESQPGYSRYGIGQSVLLIPFYVTGQLLSPYFSFPVEFHYDLKAFFITRLNLVITALSSTFFCMIIVQAVPLPSGKFNVMAADILIRTQGIHGDIYQKPDNFYLPLGIRFRRNGKRPVHVIEESSYNDMYSNGWARLSVHLDRWKPSPSLIGGHSFGHVLNRIHAAMAAWTK